MAYGVEKGLHEALSGGVLGRGDQRLDRFSDMLSGVHKANGLGRVSHLLLWGVRHQMVLMPAMHPTGMRRKPLTVAWTQKRLQEATLANSSRC
jgi:hypothetical protein